LAYGWPWRTCFLGIWEPKPPRFDEWWTTSIAFAILRERIINFHLQDNDRNRDRHLQPPYGTIDWEAFAPDFLSLNFPHPVAVEASPWNGETWGMLLREVHTLFSEGRLTLRLGKSLVRVICKQCGRYQDWYCGCGRQGGTGDG